MTAPLVPLAFAFAGGIWLGLETPAPSWLARGAGALMLVTLAAVGRNRRAAASAGLLLLVGLAGWARTALPDVFPANAGLHPGRVRVEGVVSGDPEPDGPRTRVPLALSAALAGSEPTPAAGSLLVYLYGTAPPLRAGERIRVTVDLSVPRRFHNPDTEPPAAGDRSPIPHYWAVGRAESVERLPGDTVPWPLRIRLWVHRLVRAELPPVSGALLEGLVIGERSRLPPTLLADFRAAGVFHILAISGFNVGLVAGTVFFLLRLLRLPSRGAAAVALATLAAFAVVVGGQASVLRATVMGSLILAARLLGRESGTWNGLALALLGLLALDPSGLLDPGLQLSFAATAGILHLAPMFRRALAPWCPGCLTDAVAVSLGAQLAVTPLMLARWSQLSLIGVVANLVVVPLAAALTVLGLLALLLATLSAALTHLAFQSLWVLLLGLRYVVRAFAAVPGAVVYLPAPPTLALLAFGVVLVGAPLARGPRTRCVLAALFAAAGLATVAGFLPDGRLHLVVLDVGQGDAILVRGPDGQTLLVDTGGGGSGRLDRGERVVLPLLRHLGVRRLAALAVTHGDPDHAGGLASLVEGLPIDEAWVPVGTEGAPWQQALEAAGVRRRALTRGEQLWLGPVRVTVLHPSTSGAPPGLGRRSTNNGSLVLRVDWGLVSALLTGDAEEPAEREVLEAGAPVGATLLKVGHHGSRYGSSARFLAAVGPRLAAISVGARNPFGHPSPAVLARLDAAGAAVYRTDVDGAIEVTTDADRLWVRRWGQPGPPTEFALRAAP